MGFLPLAIRTGLYAVFDRVDARRHLADDQCFDGFNHCLLQLFLDMVLNPA